MDNRAIWRGKRVDTGDWVQGLLCPPTFPGRVTNEWYIAEETDNKFGYNGKMWIYEAIDLTTVGQCTGLRDKNGKSIFEGDIINVCCYSYTECEDEAFGQIIDSRFGYALLSEENIIYLNDIQGSYKTIYTVCGNIHENPSLLKGGGQE